MKSRRARLMSRNTVQHALSCTVTSSQTSTILWTLARDTFVCTICKTTPKCFTLPLLSWRGWHSERELDISSLPSKDFIYRYLQFERYSSHGRETGKQPAISTPCSSRVSLVPTPDALEAVGTLFLSTTATRAINPEVVQIIIPERRYDSRVARVVARR